MTTATLDFNETDTTHTFAACVLCGGTLDSQFEQRDGVCFQCDPEAPALLLPTDAGRATLSYLDAQRDYHHAVSEHCDEEGCPMYDAPAVQTAYARMEPIGATLRAIDTEFAPCEDCGQLACYCPEPPTCNVPGFGWMVI